MSSARVPFWTLPENLFFAKKLVRIFMSKLIRQIHRWVSIAFTVTVIANFVALGLGQGQQPPGWVTYSPLLPLALLMFTGLYLFTLPYASRWRRRT